MKKLFNLISLIFIVFSALSQSGNSSNRISTGYFNGLRIKGVNLNAVLIQDNEYGIELEGDDIQKISYKITDNQLVIEAKAVNTSSVLKIYTPNLNYLKISDVVNLRCDSFTTDSLVLVSGGATKVTLKNLTLTSLTNDISGAAQITLTGKAEYHDLLIDGAGDVNAKDFYTRITTIDIRGAGRASIFAFEKITGKISGAAQLEFMGEPDVNDIQVSGTATFKGKSISKGKGDTVSVKIGKYEFKILEDKEKVLKEKDNKSGEEDSMDKDDNEHVGSSFTPWSGIDLGVTGYLNPDNSIPMPAAYDFLSLDYKKSVRVGLNLYEKNFSIADEYFLIGTGIGIDINNYRFKRNTRLIGNQNTITGYIDTAVNYEKSKLRLIYLNIPLLLEFNSSSDDEHAIHFAVGGIFGYNIGSKTKLVYSVNGQLNKDKAKGDFNINPFRYGLTARLGYGDGLMIFVTYDLSELFVTGQGPEVHPFAVGLSFVDF